VPSERSRSSVAFAVRHDYVAVDTCAVRVAGELDLATAPELRRTLRALPERGFTEVILDLSEVTTIDSTALSVILALHRLLSASGRLSIAAASPPFARLLEVTGLTDAFGPFTVVETDPPPSVPDGPSIERNRTACGSRPRLTPGAAAIVAVAGTAIPFARTRAEQASRWLRILRIDGDAGIALASLAGRELTQLARDRGSGPPLSPDSIVEDAARIAAARGAPAAALDILAAVLDAYRDELQPALEPDLAAYDAFIEQLANAMTWQR
jgi:anti-anti-sigma factor